MEVDTLSVLKRWMSCVTVVAMFVAVGCDEEGGVAPPPPPVPLNVTGTFSEGLGAPGLPSNDVFDIVVDSQNQAWFATQAGVALYAATGSQFLRSFTEQTLPTGLPNSKCRALHEANGKMWLGTWGGGVGVYDYSKVDSLRWTSLSTEDGLASDLVTAIASDGTDIYFATNEGISIYEDNDQIPMGSRWDSYTGADGLLDPLVSTMVIAQTPRDKEFWYGARVEFVLTPPDNEGNHGVTVKYQNRSTPIHYTPFNSGLPEVTVNDIHYDSGTDWFWVAMPNKGVARVDVENSHWRVYTTADGLPSNITYSISQGPNGQLWIGTQDGVARYNPSSDNFTGFRRGSGLPGDRVRSVFIDSGNQMWLGFFDAGGARVKLGS